jgi:hypothetical protein
MLIHANPTPSTCVTVRRSWKEWENVGACGQVQLRIWEGGQFLSDTTDLAPPFYRGVSLLEIAPEQLACVDAELARFVETGAWERLSSKICVLRLYLVPKPGKNEWRLICDIRHLNDYYQKTLENGGVARCAAPHMPRRLHVQFRPT